MPRFTVRAGGEAVGWSDLPDLDAAMGVATGTFSPGPGYERVRPVFRLFAEATGETSAQPGDEAKVARYYAARDGLGLTLHGPDGAAIATEYIHVADYSVEAGPDALELEVAAASPAAWQTIAAGRTDAPDA